MSEEITETLDTDESDGIDESTRKYLNQHNPVGELSGLIDKKVQTSATVSNIEIPKVKRIISDDSPSIQIKLTHEDINEDIIMPVQLDRFSSEDELTSMSDFTDTYGIERDEIDEIIGEEIEILMERDSSSYRATPTFQKLDKLDDKNSHSSTRIESLKSLWKAENYEKAKIVSIDSSSSRRSNRSIVTVEIPWLNEEKKILFGIGPNTSYYSLESLFESITGHSPIDEEEISCIIGEEIDVSYEGRFGLSDRLEKQIKDNEYSFKMFLADNKDTLKKMSLKNTFYAGLLYTFPPFITLPIVLLNPLFAISTFAGIIGLIGLTGVTALVFTLINARQKYGDGEPLNQ
jgi:hypothetical protein